MANDYEIFEGKTLSDVFKDIYDNSKTNKQQLEVLMKEVVGFIKDGDTAVQIIPMLKEYLEINVKNDEQLVKLATVVQRIMAAEGRISDDSGSEFGLTDAEKKQLMDAIEGDVHDLQDHQDKIISSIKGD
jgi:phosphoribosylaminoimidazole-succinocarboxamide synthase